MTEGVIIPDATMWINRTLNHEIERAIEEEVRQRMPAIVGAACASVTGRMSSFLNYQRVGNDLQITILNAYKPEEVKP